jgi:hypothetical protein
MAVLGRVGGDVTYVALLGTLLVTPKRLAIYVPTAQSLITRVQKIKEGKSQHPTLLSEPRWVFFFFYQMSLM